MLSHGTPAPSDRPSPDDHEHRPSELSDDNNRMTHFEDRESAARWLREQVERIGPGFNPDTPAEDYLHRETGEYLMTDDAEIEEHNERAAEAVELLGDNAYAIALDEIRARFPSFRPRFHV